MASRPCAWFTWILLTGAFAVGSGLPLTAVAGEGVAGEAETDRSARESQQSARRTPWTTSRITGSLEPPLPYRTERAYPNLEFDQPVVITLTPDRKRLLVAELRGRIVTFPDDPQVQQVDTFLDLKAAVPGMNRLYGVAFHPQFKQNRYVYLCYILDMGLPDGTRVSRFRVSATDPPRILPETETVLLEWPSGGHNGGCLKFGPDGYLYITTGDGSSPSPPDVHNSGQDISDLLASVLRIDVDHADEGLRYRIPADNPFVETAGARGEVWAYGFRNPWKMNFDPRTGDLWVGDVGWEMWEMIYRVERGGNYGWSIMEGPQSVRPQTVEGPTPIQPATIAHDHTESRSITGGLTYLGDQLPDLTGAYVYGDYVTGKLWGLRYEDGKITWKAELADSPLRIVTFGETPDRDLLVVGYGGTINRLVPNDKARQNLEFPQRLSETGLLADTGALDPAPGVQPYRIKVEPWADGTHAERMLGVPGTAKLGVYEKQDVQIGNVKGAWEFPGDTVFARTVSLETRAGDPASRQRIETQILHRDGDTWRAYSYVWNEEQTDATLAPAEGLDRTVTIADPAAPGGKRSQTWHIASRTECIVCHTTRAGSIHGFNVAQLDIPADHAEPEVSQIDRFVKLGLFDEPGPIQEALRVKQPVLVDPHDSAEDLDARARTYLHVNCAHCHRRGGGGTAPFELMATLSLPQTGIVDLRPTQGTFDLHGAAIVAPGDPWRSVLYYRMNKLGRGRMPHIGSTVVDVQGVSLIRDWIRQIDRPADASATATTAETAAQFRKRQETALTRLQAINEPTDGAMKIVEELLGSTSGALLLLNACREELLSEALIPEVIRKGNGHPSGHIRGLFETFTPEEQRVKRLGTVIKVDEILAIPGSAQAGRELFFNTADVQCRNCHRIGDQGKQVGPDLTAIGSRLNRGQLLEGILEPSKKVDPKFATWLVETTRGRVHSGLLVERTDEEIVLRDAAGKLLRIARDDVEQLLPQRKSLMPELLLRDMTARQVADLLAYLSQLKKSE